VTGRYRPDAVRHGLGWHAARRLVAARAPRPPVAAEDVRRVLVVLPAEETALRAAWRFVVALAAPVVPVVAGEALAFVPDAFAGAVVRLGRDALDWRGVPNRATRERLWAPGLDVAVTLGPPDELAGAVLVGASPAGLRVGVDAVETAGFYDLALGASTAGPAGELLARLGQIRPSLVPLR
jgi:hypothetical protein